MSAVWDAVSLGFRTSPMGLSFEVGRSIQAEEITWAQEPPRWTSCL